MPKSLDSCGVTDFRLSLGRMNAQKLQLAELLDFRPDEGVIRFQDQRVVILSAAALGLLRRELIDTDTARRLMMRFSFSDGYHDAGSVRSHAVDERDRRNS
jgi:activator of aromatic catabolism